ncbi:hypothetical protein [Actinobaculum sp. 352]|uniref:hypothetical protein n=1 Tax=Actinobaculum sp. 352 TaxID=2490946 RepID=UPI000F7F4127|nr:hypothetical protein [Actinobaculum sp. 352]RTE49037.1 hypothetical protein EKN07_07875 [Actinobaculum sp. 352]
MRKIAGIALGVIGLLVAFLGVGKATIWSDDRQVTAEAVPSGDTAYVLTEPGVLDMVSDTVTITASGSDDADVTIAIGYAGDVAAWAEGLSADSISGMKDWSTLAVASAAADGETTADEEQAEGDATDATEVPALADSDMWLSVANEKGSAKVTDYEVADPGNISLIATASDGKAPTVTLSWSRDVNSGDVIPLILIGVLLAIIGVLLLVLERQEARSRARRQELRQRRQARRASRAAAETTVLQAFDGDIAESTRPVQNAVTGQALGAGIICASPRSQELRSRELAEEDRLVIPVDDEDWSPEPDTAVDDEPSTASGAQWRSRWEFATAERQDETDTASASSAEFVGEPEGKHAEEGEKREDPDA